MNAELTDLQKETVLLLQADANGDEALAVDLLKSLTSYKKGDAIIEGKGTVLECSEGQLKYVKAMLEKRAAARVAAKQEVQKAATPPAPSKTEEPFIFASILPPRPPMSLEDLEKRLDYQIKAREILIRKAVSLVSPSHADWRKGHGNAPMRLFIWGKGAKTIITTISSYCGFSKSAPEYQIRTFESKRGTETIITVLAAFRLGDYYSSWATGVASTDDDFFEWQGLEKTGLIKKLQRTAEEHWWADALEQIIPLGGLTKEEASKWGLQADQATVITYGGDKK